MTSLRWEMWNAARNDSLYATKNLKSVHCGSATIYLIGQQKANFSSLAGVHLTPGLLCG